MASVRSTIDLVITGATRGLGAAAAEAEAMASRVSDAEDRVSAARTRSAAAEERVGVAEGRLNSARTQQEAALSRIGVAETNLERVRQTSVTSSSRLSQAEADLDRVRQSGSTQQIEAAEGRVNQVRQESDLAAANLQRAEAQLATARANGERASARVGEAETALNRARSDAVRASEASARAENDLNNLRRRGNQDTDTQRSGILGLFDAFSRLGNAVTGADDASNKFLSTGSALQNIFTTIGGPIAQAVIGIITFGVVLGVVIEAVGVLGGLIGQALGGAVPLLLSLGVAAGAAALGMDGIKKAAEVMQPAFEKLKTAVSGTFTRLLTPTFKELAGVLPRITGGMTEVAGAVSQVISRLVAVAASSRGIQDLQTIILGTSDFVVALVDGLGSLLRGILDIAAAAAPAMQDLGTAIGDVFGKIGTVFSTLADNGVAQKAVEGLAATIEGLANVLAPVVSLLIQMGAALGDSVGQALTSVGSGIEQVTPFFVKLADVAGKVLVDAFQQLGPPISQLVDSILPGASSGLDGFASVMHNVVLPAVVGFINWIRTDGIPGFIAFTQGIIVGATGAASAILGFVSGALGALENLFAALGVATGDKHFLEIAGQIEVAKTKVDGLKTSIDAIHDKTITALANVPSGPQVGEQGILGVNAAIDAAHDKTVTATANVPSGPLVGEQGILAVNAAIDAAHDKTVTHTANVPSGPIVGERGVLAVNAAIDAARDKTVTHTANVPSGPIVGERGVLAVNAAIDAAHDKTVTARANAVGEDAVRALQAAMNTLHDVTVHVTTVVKQIVGFRKGGRVPTNDAFLVGEDGPELLTLDGLGGVVTNAQKTRQLLAQQPGGSFTGSGSPVAVRGSDAPITVNVNISPTEIAGIAQVEIQRRDRATKRTVLAGSGATF